uniref:Uncharacterized protein n=1 Tax=Zea mays TaxID=4577 RepID=A0A804RSX3_MAIZE
MCSPARSVPRAPHLLPDEAHQPPHRALLGVAEAAVTLAGHRRVVPVHVAVHAAAPNLLLLLVVAGALVLAVAAVAHVHVHAHPRAAVATAAPTAAPAPVRAARGAAVLDGVDDAVDEVAVGRRVPARPEALVAAEAGAAHLRRVGPAAAARAAAHDRRAAAGQEVGQHLLLLGRQRRRQGQHGGRQRHGRVRVRRRRVHPPPLLAALAQLLHLPALAQCLCLTLPPYWPAALGG